MDNFSKKGNIEQARLYAMALKMTGINVDVKGAFMLIEVWNKLNAKSLDFCLEDGCSIMKNTDSTFKDIGPQD